MGEHPESGGDGPAMGPRQEALLDRIEAIFFARGYRSVTMDRLAAELRCSKRALYELAPSRQALFLRVVRRWTGRIRRSGLERAAAEADARSRLAAFLEPGVTQSVGLTEAFLADLQALPEARALLESHQRERMDRLRAIVEEGIGQGRFAPMHAHLVAAICLAGIARINDPDFLREAGLSFSAAFSELYQLLMTGLDRGGGID